MKGCTDQIEPAIFGARSQGADDEFKLVDNEEEKEQGLTEPESEGSDQGWPAEQTQRVSEVGDSP